MCQIAGVAVLLLLFAFPLHVAGMHRWMMKDVTQKCGWAQLEDTKLKESREWKQDRQIHGQFLVTTHQWSIRVLHPHKIARKSFGCCIRCAWKTLDLITQENPSKNWSTECLGMRHRDTQLVWISHHEEVRLGTLVHLLLKRFPGVDYTSLKWLVWMRLMRGYDEVMALVNM